MKLREVLSQVVFGIEARLKLGEIGLLLRALGYERTDDIVKDVRAALVEKVSSET